MKRFFELYFPNPIRLYRILKEFKRGEDVLVYREYNSTLPGQEHWNYLALQVRKLRNIIGSDSLMGESDYKRGRESGRLPWAEEVKNKDFPSPQELLDILSTTKVEEGKGGVWTEVAKELGGTGGVVTLWEVDEPARGSPKNKDEFLFDVGGKRLKTWQVPVLIPHREGKFLVIEFGSAPGLSLQQMRELELSSVIERVLLPLYVKEQIEKKNKVKEFISMLK